MNLKQFAHSEYKQYCKAEGSQHIVSEFALFHILNLVKKYGFKRILEVGVGIGTISGSLIKFSKEKGFDIEFIGTEANDFCLSQIPKNLGENFSKMNLYPEVSALSSKKKYDLIIVDGSEQNLKEIKRKMVPGGIVVIEGDRKDQVEIIKQIFPKLKYAHLISLNKNGEYSVKKSGDFQGGLKVIFTSPTGKQFLHWIRIRASTAARFQIRKFL
ncbi:hypothetical protein [Autumnicola musiva]|uniref:Methyltransferase domain-containing protein n=1 Tax=Autumnicola musiva TaxID=3075589 RepID=A0ABU3D5H8_9FLAO|nr:hypothetical protein [Zunongwangia sp. F117]MDT0676793.1 hypothetical protein [Zunongwangia sp. F117]